ncbi:MAG: 3'-5' exonuclease [Kiritimatiellia bacterium]|nr:3'-5' exonuclease [Lentisphaerota bacterium]
MQFTAIDFETANATRSSACSVGLAIVENGQIIHRIHQLLRPTPPDFHPFNVAIHGITAADVAGAPSLSEYWPILARQVRGPLVAHNAAFDMSVLRSGLHAGAQVCPAIDYFCTLVIARLTWRNQSSYGLNRLAESLCITFRHHDAAEDAMACARIALAACARHGATSLYDLPRACGLRIGTLAPDGYKPCGGPRRPRSAWRTVRPSTAVNAQPQNR